MEDINEQDSVGWTKLHFAADKNDWHRAKSLLEQKANPHIYTTVKNSPLMLSIQRRTNECFHLLLKYETQETFLHKNIGGFTVLDFAIYCSARDYVSSIIDAGGGHSLGVNTSPPPWFTELLEQRRNIKRALLVFYHFGRKNPYLKKDMTDNIAKMIWETRDREEWLTPQEGPSLKKI